MCLGLPGQIVAVRNDRPLRMGDVDFGGITKEICLATVPEAVVGDWVIVHAGFAISTVDEAAAREVLSWVEAP